MPVVQLPARTLAYIRVDAEFATEGHCSDVVLIHGLAANQGIWYLRKAPVLARRHGVLMFDLRGHGRSTMTATGYTPDDMAEDMVGLFDHLGIRSAHVVGHSYGGCVALHFSNRHPERVHSLTIADTRLRTVQPRLETRLWPSWPRLKASLARSGIRMDGHTEDVGMELFERLARLRLKQPAAMEELGGAVPSPFSGKGGNQAARRWLALIERTTARNDILYGERLSIEDVRTLPIPVLLIYGEWSQALPTAHALAEALPCARLKIVAKAGHFFPITAPNKLLLPLMAFLAECDQQMLRAAE